MNATIAQTTPAAPSAAPAPAAPAVPAATTPAAPSAPELDPTNLSYYDRVATESLKGPQAAAPVAAPAPGTESHPAAAPATAPIPDPVEAPVVQTPGADADEAEPSAEEQAAMSDSEKRIYGALKKERSLRKEDRKQLNELKDKLDKLAAPPTPEPAAPVGAPQAAPSPALEDCNTFEAVEARTMTALATNSKVTRMQTALSRNNPAAVVTALKAEGVEKIGDVPIAEATPEQLSDFLTNVQEGTQFTLAQAEPRKRYLMQQAGSWENAVKLAPDLKNKDTALAQKFVQVVTRNPWLKQQGPNWPMVALQFIKGGDALAPTPAAAAAPAPVPQPAPLPATARPAPAAPRTAHVAPAQASELDRLRARMNDGTATLDEVDRYGRLALTAPAAA